MEAGSQVKSQKMLTIKEVSQWLGVSRHTLRFWEKELRGIIVPLRTEGGQRRYTLDHLLLIKEIKRLKKQGFSLVDIKENFSQNNNTPYENSNTNKVDLLANQIADIVKSAISNFLKHENKT
jgi:DNA-binding transcriptional MerR regulator